MKNTSLFLLTLSLFVSAIVSPGSARAAEDNLLPHPRPAEKSTLAPHVGIFGGVTHPNGSPAVAGDYGIDIGFQPYVPFGLGLQVGRYSTGNSANPNGIDISRTPVLLKVSYNFGGDIPILHSSYIGLKGGAVFEEFVGDSRTRLGLAPMIGFDHRICEVFTVGAEAAYLGVVGPDSAGALSLNVLVKYWF